jgi:ribosomal protein S6--L-glutamate ligase
MRIISLDILRTLKFPSHTYIKPEHFFQRTSDFESADWVLYPEYWQVKALVYGLNARVFPSLPTYLIGHDKVEMTRVFQCIVPQNIPETHIHGNTSEKARMLWERMSHPFVAKIPRSSMGEGVFLIENLDQWRTYCSQTDVLYVQEWLPIDRDLRLVVIGERVVGGYWRLQSSNGFHNNIARGGEVFQGVLPPQAVQLVETVARTLGIDHAGFDVAMVGDHPYLFEFNRLFGTQGVESMIGDISHFILEYLRYKLYEFDPTSPNSPKGPKLGGGGRLSPFKKSA